jgi:hypothetical protein
MNKELTASLAWAGGIIALALGATLARELNYIDGDSVTRIVLGATGLMVAWYGNRMPKSVVGGASERQANRVAGWSMTLSGLVYAGLWAFAPVTVAVVGGCAAVVAGIAVTIGYARSLRSKSKAV